jgi:hypothetical protein
LAAVEPSCGVVSSSSIKVPRTSARAARAESRAFSAWLLSRYGPERTRTPVPSLTATESPYAAIPAFFRSATSLSAFSTLE